MKKYIVLTLVAALLFSINVIGTENIEAVAEVIKTEISLEEAYAEALYNNWDIKKIDRQMRELNYMIKDQKVLKDNIIINENTTDYVASILIKDGYGVENGKYNLMVLNNLKEQTSNTIKLSVMTNYYNLILAEKEIDLQNKAYESAQKNYKDALLKYESGIITKILLTKAELAVNKSKTGLENAQDEFNIKNLELSNILNKNLDTQFSLDPEINYVSSLSIDLNKSIETAINKSSLIMEKNELIKLKKIVLDATDAYYTAGNWQLRHAQEEVEEAEFLYKKAFRDVELDTRKKYFAMIKAEKSYKNMGETVLISQEALRIAKLFYKYDLATISDVNDAEIGLKEAEIAKNSLLVAYSLSREIFLYSLDKGILLIQQ